MKSFRSEGQEAGAAAITAAMAALQGKVCIFNEVLSGFPNGA